MKLEQIDLLSCQIRRTEGFLVEEARPSPFFQALQAIPGVGYVLALTIYYEMADPARFPSARNFASYCRLVPSTAESAGKVKKGAGAKHGNPWLKWGEPVNNFETPTGIIQGSTSPPSSSSGLLIQTSSGRAGASGTLPTNLSGCEA